MKIRQGFVSNSSSSSFLITNKEVAEVIGAILLPKRDRNALKRCMQNLTQETNSWNTYEAHAIYDLLSSDIDVYLTPFMSDGGDDYSNIADIGIELESGGHGVPYDMDDRKFYGDGEREPSISRELLRKFK